jgi:hypothetical protein
MRIGLLADIHEDVERLDAAIVHCRSAGSDRLLTLGDIYQDGRRFAESVKRLAAADVEGVWGNHELGLCHEPGDWVDRMFDPATRAYMARLRPRMEIEGLLLGHVLPRHDPTDITQPWYVEGVPMTAEEAGPDFAAFPHRRMFLGHYHRWLIATPEGVLPWTGTGPIRFDPARRYLIVVAAVCNGWCAVHDTTTDTLIPLALDRV